MDYFHYYQDQLLAENVPVTKLAEQWGTPLYIYSKATIERHWHVFDEAFESAPHLICYAVKANSNIAILNVLARLGSGFDIVSLGELERVLVAKGDPKQIVFSGVAKTRTEMARALSVGIGCFNVESLDELKRLNEVAKELNLKAPIALRVNPDIESKTHPYISTGLRENKFGVAYDEAENFYHLAAQLSHIQIKGIACHIGSQITELSPFTAATRKIAELTQQLLQQGFELEHIDLGGGLAVRYTDENPPSPHAWVQTIIQNLGFPKKIKIIIEPGRAIIANAGILVTKVEYLKHTAHRNFAIVDAGMNDLIRPALYQATQEIIPAQLKSGNHQINYDVVGPVCETGDFLGKDRMLDLAAHDLLAIRTAGAYGFSMSSNYNSRPRAAEIMVDNDQAYLIRARETIEDLFTKEMLLPK